MDEEGNTYFHHFLFLLKAIHLTKYETQTNLKFKKIV
jgi:hypothetical protein